MNPIIFNSVQDLIIFSFVVLAIGVWIGGAIMYKVATKLTATKEHAIAFHR